MKNRPVSLALALSLAVVIAGCRDQYGTVASANDAGGNPTAQDSKDASNLNPYVSEVGTQDPAKISDIDEDLLARQFELLATTDVFQTPFNFLIGADSETGNTTLSIFRPTTQIFVEPGRRATELLATVVFRSRPDGALDVWSLSDTVKESNKFARQTEIAAKILFWMRTNRPTALEFRCGFDVEGRESGDVFIIISYLPRRPHWSTHLTYSFDTGKVTKYDRWQED